MRRDRLTIFSAVAATLVFGAALLAIDPVRDAVTAAGDPAELRYQLNRLGAAAVLVLMAIALVHVVVPFPAEFPTAAAGFVFGFAIAFPLMVFAWTLSCVAAYFFAHVVGPPVLDKLFGAERMRTADTMIERGGWPVLLFGRLIPIVPYNVVSFAAGATRVPLWRFTWTTAVGVMPLTALTALLGDRGEILRELARDPVEHEPARAGAPRGGHAADPALDGAREPLLDVGRDEQLREALDHALDVGGGGVGLHRRPLLGLPVEAAARDRPHGVHDVRPVREGEDDRVLTLRVAPQLDVVDRICSSHEATYGSRGRGAPGDNLDGCSRASTA
jgi:uncharacterized membrane protein YdjX (TVP38/TMEM64 family)